GVDEAILVIVRSGIDCKVGPFATVVEGTYAEVMDVVNRVNEHLFSSGCDEWIASVQINMRSKSDITADEKVSKFS
ncbi:MAG: thiamine-binding protein, partial [Segetibacter sp.]|nr:thiamine-binding protein [Segetibacter sp.]